MVEMSMAQLAGAADTIVVGTVLEQKSAWNDDRSAIYTDVVVGVDEPVKGDPGAQVVVRVPGGYIPAEDIGMGTSNAPVFRDGEQVVLFLNAAGQVATVTGQFQGKWTVTNGTVTTGTGQTFPVDELVGTLRDATN